jgi:hypothetical protein
MQLTPDSREVFLAFGDGWLTTFDLDTLSVTRDLRHCTQVASAVVTPDGRRIVSAGQDRTILVWDVASGTPIARFLGGGDYRAVDVSDRLIAVGGSAGGVLMLELEGADIGPRCVPLLEADRRRFWVCPYCKAESTAAAESATEALCGSCRRTLKLSPTLAPVRGRERSSRGIPPTLGDFIGASSPPAGGPASREPRSWFRRLLMPWKH